MPQFQNEKNKETYFSAYIFKKKIFLYSFKYLFNYFFFFVVKYNAGYT